MPCTRPFAEREATGLHVKHVQALERLKADCNLSYCVICVMHGAAVHVALPTTSVTESGLAWGLQSSYNSKLHFLWYVWRRFCRSQPDLDALPEVWAKSGRRPRIEQDAEQHYDCYAVVLRLYRTVMRFFHILIARAGPVLQEMDVHRRHPDGSSSGSRFGLGTPGECPWSTRRFGRGSPRRVLADKQRSGPVPFILFS